MLFSSNHQSSAETRQLHTVCSLILPSEWQGNKEHAAVALHVSLWLWLQKIMDLQRRGGSFFRVRFIRSYLLVVAVEQMFSIMQQNSRSQEIFCQEFVGKGAQFRVSGDWSRCFDWHFRGRRVDWKELRRGGVVLLKTHFLSVNSCVCYCEASSPTIEFQES